MSTKIRIGMVGGGEGSFIGAVHRMAARLDDRAVLVAGCFSRNAERNVRSAEALGLAPDRVYTTYQDMLQQEQALPEEQRIHCVVIVTPNDSHLPIAEASLNAGFHVLSDKPATANYQEVLKLREAVVTSSCHYALTHTYAGYPMVRQAKAMVADGKLGEIRRITVTYAQGWLAHAEDAVGSKQAEWRTDPKAAGDSGCFADIGTHAHQLVEFISGLHVREVCADIGAVVEGRTLDDDGSLLFRMDGGAKGTLTASQVLSGEGNNLSITVHGEHASLHWQQENPTQLVFKPRKAPQQIYTAGTDVDYLYDDAKRSCRTPAGHPEGYIEAFANLYCDFAALILNEKKSAKQLAGIEESVRGMAFIHGVLQSAKSGSSWQALGPLWE